MTDDLYSTPAADIPRRAVGSGPRPCVRCGVVFNPDARTPGDHLITEEADMSDHCTACWIALTEHRGRPLGRPDLPSTGWRGLPADVLPPAAKRARGDAD